MNRWQIRIPEPGVKVNVQPNISATDGGAQTKDEDAKPDQPCKRRRKRRWCRQSLARPKRCGSSGRRRRKGPPGLAALVTVQARQEVTIDEGVVHTRTNLAYDIQRADVTQLTVEVPADHNVVNVFDPNVQKWEKKTEGPIQTLTITLFQPTRGTQNVVIELEKFAGDKEMPQEMTHAEIRAPGRAGRASRNARSDEQHRPAARRRRGRPGDRAAGRGDLADRAAANRRSRTARAAGQAAMDVCLSLRGPARSI